ncbi:MAG TPA: hypothetical protein PLT66_01280 [Bacillota bacterium]|nr:hypothetical protein [Bacillota bacterium]
MLKILVRSQLGQLSAMMFSRDSKFMSGKQGVQKQRSDNKTKRILLYVFLFVMMCISFGSIFSAIFLTLHESGNDKLYFMLTAGLSFFFGIFMSIFTAQKMLYGAKDNEMLLSMPIRPVYILLSRIIALAVLEYISSFMLTLPALIVFITFGSPGALQIILFILSSLVMPLLSLAIVMVLGRVFAAISARAKHKSIVQLIVSLIFLGAYFYIYTNIMSFVETIADNAQQINAAIAFVRPLLRFAEASANGSIVSFLLLVLWCVIPFALVLWWLSHGFIQIVTNERGAVRVKYVKKHVDRKSPLRALLSRELSRFFNMSQYMLNCGLGTLMAVVLSVFLAIKGGELDSAFTGTGVALTTLFPVLLLSFSASMTCTSCVSISLEGNTFWLLRSLPVKTKDVLISKVLMNLVIFAPAVIIGATVTGIAFGMSVAEIVMTMLCAMLAQLMTALFGLLMNLALPKLEWTNSTVVIKQSASVVIALFGSMIGVLAVVIPLTLLLGITLQTVIPAYATLIAVTASALAFAFISAILAAILFTAGARRYNNL